MADMRATYVSHKINKVRWRPSQKQSLQDSDVFATGSWDDEINKLSLWQYEGQKAHEATDKGDRLADPTLLCEVAHQGDVTGLEYIGQELIVTSSSAGYVSLYRHYTDSKTLGIQFQWHPFQFPGDRICPCTCAAVRDKTIATAGEDGRIVILHAEHKPPQRVIENADSSTINSLVFLKQTDIITVNSAGQLKTYDLRTNTDSPSHTLSVSGELTSLHCVDRHPGQPHIVATGSQDGVLGIWDLRQEKFPVSLMEAHGGTMWEVKFHKSNSDHLFTCSEDGSVWHWDCSLIGTDPVAMVAGHTQLTGTGAGSGGGNFSVNPSFQYGGSEVINKWLSTDIDKNKMEVTSLIDVDDHILPVNSIDIESQTLLCGTDGESIISIDLPILR